MGVGNRSKPDKDPNNLKLEDALAEFDEEVVIARIDLKGICELGEVRVATTFWVRANKLKDEQPRGFSFREGKVFQGETLAFEKKES